VLGNKLCPIYHETLGDRFSLDPEYAASLDREYTGHIDENQEVVPGVKHTYGFTSVAEVLKWKKSLVEYEVKTPNAEYNLRHRRFLQNGTAYVM